MTAAPPTMGFVKLVTHDIEGLLPFYTDVFDFKVQYRVSANEDDPGYNREWALDEILLHNANDQGTTLVLFEFRNREVVPAGGVILGISVPDIKVTLEKATAAGGTVARPLQVQPQHGVKVAFVTDPRGTLIEVIELLPKQS